MPVTIATLTLKDIKRVYSGIDGKCCCGCSGKYWEADAVRCVGVDHGSEIYVPDTRMITKVFNLLKAAPGECQQGSNHIARVVGGRLYIAYFAE